jgi:hypothetical protein
MLRMHMDVPGRLESTDATHTRRTLLGQLGRSGGLAAALLLGGGAATPTLAADVPALVGSWLVNRSDDGIDLNRRWTATFTADGNVIAQALGGGPNPVGNLLSSSIGNGVWAQRGERTFGFTQLHVRYVAQSGQPFSLFKWSGTIVIDDSGDTFSIRYRSNPLNPATLQTEQIRTQLEGTAVRVRLDDNSEAT